MDPLFSSWKEIAAFFGRGVRTVQRWEKDCDLPVHRPANSAKNIVFARQSELAAWLQQAAATSQRSATIQTILFFGHEIGPLHLIRIVLEGEGYLVFTCVDPGRASEIIHHGPRIDLLLIDTGTATPEHSGVQLALDLTRNLTHAQGCLPVIVAAEKDTIVQPLDQTSGWNILPKPFHLSNLLGLIQNILGNRDPALPA